MATVTKPDRSLIGVLGPFKVEVVILTAVSDGDTFNSKLQNPSFAVAFNNGDASGANNISAAISGKTVTIHDPDLTTVICLVFGDSLT
ncbi:MAG: hypothetical protein SVK08_00845 [Halobacteriota archaeon]|nr:hypothetical protein [Halobacteriota archaeon]